MKRLLEEVCLKNCVVPLWGCLLRPLTPAFVHFGWYSSVLFVLWKEVFPWSPLTTHSLWKHNAKNEGHRQVVDLELSQFTGEWFCANNFNRRSLRLLILKMGLIVTIGFTVHSDYCGSMWGPQRQGQCLFDSVQLPRCWHRAGPKLRRSGWMHRWWVHKGMVMPGLQGGGKAWRSEGMGSIWPC